MKATGIVRRLDDLGRIVLPMELRKTMDLPEGTPMEIFVEGDTIIIKKYVPACVFCGETKNVSDVKSKRVCKCCREDIKG